MYNFKSASLSPKIGQRILITSDIHGHIDHFKALLEQADFRNDDLLIIVGDIAEKGPNSLEVLRYVMKLSEEKRALVIMGNVDCRFLWQIDNITDLNSAEEFLAYLRYMRDWKGTSLYDEMCKEIGKLPETAEDVLESLKKIKVHFKAELDFFENMPTVLETPKYIFVHGGLPISEEKYLSIRDSETDSHRYLKLDNFVNTAREKGLKFNRYVVSGHWPVSIYGEDISQVDPIIDNEMRIISIDGGCGLHNVGQLNLLVLPSLDCEPEEIQTMSYDGYPKITALSNQEASEDPINIRWGDNDVKLLDVCGDCAEIEHMRTKKRLWIPADFLYVDIKALKIGDITRVNTVTDYKLPVSAGDKLSVVSETEKGILAKKNGVVGWYYGKV